MAAIIVKVFLNDNVFVYNTQLLLEVTSLFCKLSELLCHLLVGGILVHDVHLSTTDVEVGPLAHIAFGIDHVDVTTDGKL